MSLPDAAEARRISAQLATLEQQREQGNLPHEDTPFRLYRVRTGGFVRVLDQHPEPISQGMLDAIDAFIRRSTDSEELEEKEAAAEEEKEETRQDNDGEEADAVNHLGKERDYVLYLALWAATSGESSGSTQPDIASLSTSEIIASLKMSAARTSSLETYQKLLPSWTFSAARIGDISNGQVPGAALYDPYEQESARTKDPYWNEIQKFLVEQQYLHPLLVVYWAYRLMTWNVSSRAAIAVRTADYSVGSVLSCI
ncbi:hypothetical protein JG687_00004858 [Phytophthora cactorum]|uniref:Uncharacterized protein n=1 Tax=Phytophthora cactorum TaxID=29920 RepID=A0A8T1UNU5_9STRA|nr:hypothetical protein JG687_00004858 [Phytophthora cactorum]